METLGLIMVYFEIIIRGHSQTLCTENTFELKKAIKHRAMLISTC